MDMGTLVRKKSAVRYQPLCEAVSSRSDDARPSGRYRQRAYDVLHYARSVVPLFADVDKRPQIVVTKEAGRSRLADIAIPLYTIAGVRFTIDGAPYRFEAIDNDALNWIESGKRRCWSLTVGVEY